MLNCRMNKSPARTGLRLTAVLMWIFAAALTLHGGDAMAGGAVDIITHSDHAGVALDRPLLRAIFMMRTRLWPDGAPVRVFVLSDTSEIHDQFCRENLGTYPYVLRGIWDRMVYTGTGLAPVTLNSQEELIEKVRSTPGAIGYYRHADAAQSGQVMHVNYLQGANRP